MLRRSLKFLVISLVIFLSFNSNVYADKIPELTCRYYNDKVNWMITQKSDGTGYLYRNEGNGSKITAESSGWVSKAPLGDLKWGDKYKSSTPKLSNSKPKYLKECPVGFIKKGLIPSFYIFSSKTSDGYKTLDGTSGDKIVEFRGGVNNYTKPSIANTGTGSSTIDSDNSGDVPIDVEVGFIDTRDQQISCTYIFGEDGEIIKLIKTLLNLVKIIVPVLVIVLGSLDFVSAIFSQDDGNMKKAQTKFIKRLIIAVAIFVAPSILKFILDIGHGIWPVVDASLCGILD